MYDQWNQAVDAILREVHQLDPSVYGTGDLAIHRRQITANGNRVLRRIYGLRDWTFKYLDNVEVTIPANDHESNDLPADWVNEGRQGGVWTIAEPLYQLQWERAGSLRNRVNTAPDETGQPIWYSVIRNRKLLVFPKDSVTRTLHASYEAQTPLLTDATDEVGGIDALPYQWRHVLYEWTAAREMKDAGDITQYRETMDLEVGPALFDMCCGEAQGKPQQEMMPAYAGAPVESDWMDW